MAGNEEPTTGGEPSSEGPDGGAARLNRRAALQKAAAAAAVSGAVWSAPKVSGLSVIPDYAAAATGLAAAKSLIIDAAGNAGNFGDGCDALGSDYLYFATTSAPTPAPEANHGAQDEWSKPGANFRAQSAPVVLNTSLPSPAGVIADVTVELDTNSADRNPSSSALFDVTFSNIDPPFNNCRVTTPGSWTRCGGASEDAPTGGPPSADHDLIIGPQPYYNSPPTQRNPSSSFTVPVTTTTGPLYTDISRITIQVRCD